MSRFKSPNQVGALQRSKKSQIYWLLLLGTFTIATMILLNLWFIQGVFAAPFMDPEPSRHPNNFEATADSSTQITTTWTDPNGGTTLPTSYLLMCNLTGIFVAPTDLVPVADDTDCSDGSGMQNIAFGIETAVWSGLDTGTPYFFTIYSYTNTGIEVDYKINGVVRTADATTLEEVDIAITNTESIDPVNAGSGSDNLLHEVTVTNNGPANATNLIVDQTIVVPAVGVTISAITVTQGSHNLSTASTNINGDWAVGALANGQDAKMTVAYTVDNSAAAGADVISSVAFLQSVDAFDTVPGNNSAGVATSITASPASLTITQETEDGDTTSFAYTGDLGNFSLSDGGSETDNALTAGEYTINQGTQAGWVLDDVVCTGGSPVETANGVTVTLGGGDAVTCTFKNVKDLPTFSIGPATVTEGNSGQVNLEFDVTRSSNTFANSVDVASQNGTAQQPADYVALPATTLNFPANGSLTQSIVVTVKGDEVVEADETIKLLLSNPVNATILVAEGVGTIEDDDIATLTLSGTNVISEGTDSNQQVIYTATLDKAVQGGFQVEKDTLSGSAKAGTDFKDADGIMTFVGNAGEVQQFTLETLADSQVEEDEFLTVSLQNITNTDVDANRIQFAGSPIITTIQNDDVATVTLLPGTSKSEGDSGTTEFTFSAILNSQVSGGFSVSYAAESDTAVAGQDFATSQEGSITFSGAKGEIETFTIEINGDSLVEADETFAVQLKEITGLSNPGSVEIVDGEQFATILNDDVATVTLSGGVTQNEGDTGTVAYIFTAELDSDVDGSISIDYATEDGTATVADNDYNAQSGSWTFSGNAGETKTVTVTANGDTNGEAPETFFLALGDITVETAGIEIQTSGSPQEATIANDDAAVLFVDAPDSVSEGGSSISVAVSLSTVANSVVTVDYATSNGTATAGADYTAVSDSVTFQPGETSKLVEIPLIDDESYEGDETVIFTISNPSGLTLGEPSTVEITIIENESGVIVSVIEPMSANEADGEAEVSLGLNQASTEPVEVTLTTGDGSAVAGQDYTAVSAKVVFAAGETTKTITIPLIDDSEAEGDEDIVLTLSDPVNASLEDNPIYPFVIVDNENVLSASISGVEMLEADSGETMMIFEVTLSTPVEYDVKIRYRTEDDTAVAGQDYVGVEGDLVIQAGRIQGFIGVLVLGDTKKEGDETFNLILNGVTEDGFGPIAATNTVVGTIQEDDQVQQLFLPLVTR